MISLKFCHLFVGYLEEEAVITYTGIIKRIKTGVPSIWKILPESEVAAKYSAHWV